MSLIPYAQNDFISTDITEGKSSILSKLVHNAYVYVFDVTWFSHSQYNGILWENLVMPLLKVLKFVIVSVFLISYFWMIIKCGCIMFNNDVIILIIIFSGLYIIISYFYVQIIWSLIVQDRYYELCIIACTNISSLFVVYLMVVYIYRNYYYVLANGDFFS